MVKVVECAYKTTDKPDNPTQYARLQLLADVKIDSVFSENKALKQAINLVENCLICGIPYDKEEIKKLAESASDIEEEKAFKRLLEIE